jgi:hypothetical protein
MERLRERKYFERGFDRICDGKGNRELASTELRAGLLGQVYAPKASQRPLAGPAGGGDCLNMA